MKKNLLQIMLLASVCMLANWATAQTRYIDKIFSSVSKTANIEYDSNVSVNLLYGRTLPPPYNALTTSPVYTAHMVCDVYQPTGDAATARPLIILLHTGSFLPTIINQQTTGSKDDSATVELANQFAMRGYVVATVNYRLGWNPLATGEAATEQLLQATYRGLQDARNAVRFFRFHMNTYKIDTSKIIVGGQGTGGYIVLGMATVSTTADIESNPKFLKQDLTPMVPTAAFGNWLGLGGSPTYNMAGDAAVSSDIDMVFNFGGAMGDIRWMKPTSTPIVSMQGTHDIFAPYDSGNVIVPTTGAVVIPNASGAHRVIAMANSMGINSKLNSVMYVDAVGMRGMAVSGGINNLFGFETSPVPVESAPWEYWDHSVMNSITSVPYRGIPLPANGHVADSLSSLTNPTMSSARGKAYIDTIARFVSPRIAVQMDITGSVGLSAFNLTTPTNGASLDIRDTVAPVVISWQTSKASGAVQGTTMYTLMIDTITGNFSAPKLVIPVADTTMLVVTEKMLFDNFSNVGIGSSIYLKWRVMVKNSYYGRNAQTDYPITLNKKSLNSVSENDYSAYLNVYPNPASSNLRINMDLSKPAISQLILLDITGREVARYENLNTYNQSITLDGLGSGVYFINVKAANGATATKRFVVQ